MSLATRLSAFFLLALALVLAGFSATLYFLARTYLVGQLDERLQHALETLEASVDIEPGGLEWEPADRQMSLGVEQGAAAVRWAVRDGRGALVDRSANARSRDFPSDWMPPAWPTGPADGTSFGTAPGWRLAARRLRLEDLLRQGRGHPDDEPGYEVQYPALVLVVGLSPNPVEATLGRLGWALSVLSLVVWMASLAVGRWLCRRALSPVSRMAGAAIAMTAADLGQRLPIPGTGDEFDALGRAFNDLLDRLHQAFVRLHAAYDGQRRFAGDASHQLRTPVAALLGQVQVALRRDRAPQEYRQVLERVQAEGLRLRQIVESLLLLARAGRRAAGIGAAEPGGAGCPNRCAAGPPTRGPRTCAARLRTTVRSWCGSIRHCSGSSSTTWSRMPASTAPGTPILVRARREEGSVILGVEDRGCGLTAEDRSRVFEPFYRAEQARRAGHAGVGLGLAVAQQIATAFGGSLTVTSAPGAGCDFRLHLPEARNPAVLAVAAQGEREGHPGV